MKYEIRHRLSDEIGIQLLEDNNSSIGALFFTLDGKQLGQSIFCHPKVKEKLEDRMAEVLKIKDELEEKIKNEQTL